MSAFPAEIPEIVRSARKDEDHLATLRNYVHRLLTLFGGPALIIKFHEISELVADTAYYSVTTLSGLQTLGEEYLSLVQVDRSGRRLPSSLQRILFIVCQVYTPYILRTLSGRLAQSQDQNHTSSQKLLSFVVRYQKELVKIHLIGFYLFGTYYHIGKRLSGVQYLSLRPQTDQYILTLFRYLANVYLIQLVCSALIFVWKAYRKNLREKIGRKTDSEASSLSEQVLREESQSTSNYTCPICISNCQPASTPCGHILCWNCAVQVCNRGISVR